MSAVSVVLFGHEIVHKIVHFLVDSARLHSARVVNGTRELVAAVILFYSTTVKLYLLQTLWYYGEYFIWDAVSCTHDVQVVSTTKTTKTVQHGYRVVADAPRRRLRRDRTKYPRDIIIIIIRCCILRVPELFWYKIYLPNNYIKWPYIITS